MAMIVSIFNDVIGPVMRGPSSSHCAAALRIGRLARDLMDGKFTEVLVEFDRKGALPTTHETHGSDRGLFGGLLGWDAADEKRLAENKAALCGSACHACETSPIATSGLSSSTRASASSRGLLP